MSGSRSCAGRCLPDNQGFLWARGSPVDARAHGLTPWQHLMITSPPQAGNIALTAAKPPKPWPARKAPTRARTRGSAPCRRRGPLRSFRDHQVETWSPGAFHAALQRRREQLAGWRSIQGPPNGTVPGAITYRAAATRRARQFVVRLASRSLTLRAVCPGQQREEGGHCQTAPTVAALRSSSGHHPDPVTTQGSSTASITWITP